MSNLFFAAKLTNVTPSESLLIALIGTVLVFVVLILLMYIIQLMGKVLNRPTKDKPFIFSKLFASKTAPASQEKEVIDTDTPTVQTAKGSYGDVALIKTEERDAAMIMAIVADATQTPLNELRFKSIKRIDGGLTQ